MRRVLTVMALCLLLWTLLLCAIAAVYFSLTSAAPPRPAPEAYWTKRMCEMPRYWHLRQCAPYRPDGAIMEGTE